MLLPPASKKLIKANVYLCIDPAIQPEIPGMQAMLDYGDSMLLTEWYYNDGPFGPEWQLKADGEPLKLHTRSQIIETMRIVEYLNKKKKCHVILLEKK